MSCRTRRRKSCGVNSCRARTRKSSGPVSCPRRSSKSGSPRCTSASSTPYTSQREPAHSNPAASQPPTPLYRATPKAMRGVFFQSFLALSFPHSNHRATRYVIREFVCTPSLSLSLSRTLFRATSIAMRGVGDFPHIETPFPPVPYALRALAAIETSTGSGLRPRRPTLSLSCTCRTPSRQRR